MKTVSSQPTISSKYLCGPDIPLCTMDKCEQEFYDLMRDKGRRIFDMPLNGNFLYISLEHHAPPENKT